MNIEEHISAFEEHERKLKDCIEEGIEKNQRNIAYNASQGSVELFSIYMHRLNLTTPGEKYDHRTFKKKSETERRIPKDFPKREKILELMKIIEENRMILCYGKRKPYDDIKEVIEAFTELKKIIDSEVGLS